MQKYTQAYRNMPETLTVVGQITGLNTGATIVLGKGYTAAKNGTGVYEITIDQPFKAAVAVGIYGISAAAARTVQYVGYDVSTRKVSFRLIDASGAAADGAAAGTIDFNITLFLSGLPLK